MTFLSDVIYGLIGKTGFVVAIPVLLYLFVIHAFSGNKPIRVRTISLSAFVLICGCISHLVLNPQGLPSGFGFIQELFIGGADGTTGGLICGCLAIVMKLLCGPIISYIVLVLTGLVLFLAGMQITIPSIIRAIRNRPRPEFEDIPEPREEPAAVVVNHIANKRIEYLERRRKIAEETQYEGVDFEDVKITNIPVETTPKQGKLDAIISQIDADVDVPVAISNTTEGTDYTSDPEILPIGKSDKTVATEMPPLDMDTVQDPIPTAEQKVSVAKEEVTHG